MSLIMDINLEDYAFEVESEQGFVFVSFYGNNCAPCRELSPIIEVLSEEYKHRLKFCKINVNENMKVAKELRIMGLPTVLIYHSGYIVYRETGFQNKNAFDSLFKELEIV